MVEPASIKRMLFTGFVWEGYCFQPQQCGKGCVLIPGLGSVKAHSCIASVTGYKQQHVTI